MGMDGPEPVRVPVAGTAHTIPQAQATQAHTVLFLSDFGDVNNPSDNDKNLYASNDDICTLQKFGTFLCREELLFSESTPKAEILARSNLMGLEPIFISSFTPGNFVTRTILLPFSFTICSRPRTEKFAEGPGFVLGGPRPERKE